MSGSNSRLDPGRGSLPPLSLSLSLVAAAAGPSISRAPLEITTVLDYCSASMIAPNLVITAAHCVASFGPGGTCYTSGSFRASEYSGTRLYVANWQHAYIPSSYQDGTWLFVASVGLLDCPLDDCVSTVSI